MFTMYCVLCLQHMCALLRGISLIPFELIIYILPKDIHIYYVYECLHGILILS